MTFKYSFGRIQNCGDETLSLVEIVRCWEEDLAKRGIFINPYILKRVQRSDTMMTVYVSLLHSNGRMVKPQAGRDAPRNKITLKTLCGLWYLLLRIAYDPGFFCLLQAYSKACLAGIPYRDNWKLESICWDIRELNHDGRIATRRLNPKYNGYREMIKELNEKTNVISLAKEAAELDRAVSEMQWKLLNFSENLPALAYKNDRVTARELLSSIDAVIPGDISDEADKTKITDKSVEELGIQQAAARLVTDLKLDADPLKVAGYLQKNLLRPELKRMKQEMREKEQAENKAYTEKLKQAKEQYEQEIENLKKAINDKDERINELRGRIAANADPARGSTKKRSS